MGYIVATSGLDQRCESYAEACATAQAIRRNGGDAVIVTADAEWRYWDVWNSYATPHVVNARTAGEALLVARAITGDRGLNAVQRRYQVSVEVTRPDGTVDVIEACGPHDAAKYVQRYTARGWKARVI